MKRVRAFLAGVAAFVLSLFQWEMRQPEKAEASPEGAPEPMTRAQAARWVHHLVRQHLEGEAIPGHEAIASDESQPERDRVDAKLVVEVARDFLVNLDRIDAALIASERKVVVTPAARQILAGKGGFRAIPGGRR